MPVYEVSERDARQLMDAEAVCFGEGQTGLPVGLLRLICQSYPHLEQEYRWLTPLSEVTVDRSTESS